MEPNFVSGKALIILLPLLLSLYKSKNCREIRSKSTFIVMKKWIKRSHHRWLRIRSKVNVNWWLLWKNFENQSRMFWKVGDTWKLKRLHILLWHAAPSSAFLAFKMSFQKQKQKKKSKKKRKEKKWRSQGVIYLTSFVFHTERTQSSIIAHVIISSKA